ncbi:MAG: hypothetical protein R2813_12925 [Flavobacteriales bacterium]
MLLSCSVSSFAQSSDWGIRVLLGSEFDIDKSYVPKSIIAANRNRIIGYAKVNTNETWLDEQILELYDKELGRIGHVKPILGTYGQDDYQFTEFACAGDACLTIGKREDHNHQQVTYGAVAINLNNLTAADTVSVLSNMKLIADEQVVHKGEFFVASSPDGSHVATLEVPLKRLGEKVELKLNVYNGLGSIEWQNHLDLNVGIEAITPNELYVLNYGIAVVLSGLTTSMSSSGQLDQPGYNVAVFHGDNPPISVNVLIEGWRISYARADINGRGNLVFAGFLSKTQGPIATGWFYREISLADGSVISSSEGAFTADFVLLGGNYSKNEVYSGYEAGKEYGIPEFAMRDLVITDDGAVICGEAFIIKEDKGLNFDYGEVVCVKVSRSGEMLWTRKLTKHQHSINDNGIYSSVLFGAKRNEFFAIFNDTPKNIKNVDGKPDVCNLDQGDVTTVAVRIDNSGNVEKRVLFDKEDLNLCPTQGFRAMEHLYAYRLGKKKAQLIRFDFD